METLVDLSTVLRNLVTALALLIGGFWAYFKYVRGRTLVERLKVSVDGHLDSARGLLLVNAAAEASNIGARELLIAQNGTVLSLFAHRYSETDSEAQEASWELVGTWNVFQGQRFLEPGETVQEHKIIEIPAGRFSALMLELNVYSESGRNWIAQAVVSSGTSGDNS